MADIRINALATTATTPASDDYLALDGTAQGTRKILATNIANNVTDVILGTSGPSVKSTLSARAPRQGLVFDGSGTKATVTLPAFGTGDFTASAWVREDNSFAGTPIVMIGSGVGGFYMEFDANGFPYVAVQGGAGVQRKATTACVVKKLNLITYVKTSGTGIWYVNGIAAGSATDSNNYTVGVATFSDSSPYNLTGFLSPLIYNRALSASEVVSLYEAGAPAGADYNSASNTAINTGFANSGLAYTTFSGASATGFTATSNGSGLHIAWMTPQAVSLTPGQRFLVTLNLTLNSGTAPSVSFGATPTVNNLKSNVQLLTAGANSFVLTATAGGTSDLYFYNNSTATNYSVSSVSVTRLGLLLAPDAAQAGGGLVWYDTSGNAANITLPASGVSWNVPFGNNIAASGTNQNITLTPSGTGSVLAHDTNAFYRNTNSGSDTATKLKVKTASNAFLAIDGGAATSGVSFGIYNSASNPVRQSAVVGIASNTTAGSEAGYLSFFTQTGGSSLTERGRFTETGNYLIGTTTDGGQKLQVSGTAYVSGSLITADDFRVQATTKAYTWFKDATPTKAWGIGSNGWAGLSGGDGSMIFGVYTGSAWSKALELDNATQNATFAGNVYIQSGNALRLYNPTNSAFASIQMDSNNVVNVNYTTAFGVTIRTQGGTASTPASASAAGVAGTIQWDANYIYVCTAANTWKRVAIATW